MESIRIPLTSGKYAVIDADMLESVSRFTWRARPHRYTWYADGKREFEHGWHWVSLHHLVLGVRPMLHIDHIDRDGLNNTRENLRACTFDENMINRRLFSSNTSGYRGVVFHPLTQRWRAQITHKGRFVHVGMFTTAEEAARAWDAKVRELRGDRAQLNFPAALVD